MPTVEEQEEETGGEDDPLSRSEDAEFKATQSTGNREETKRILKNLIVMGFIYFLVFVAYCALADLQSSLFIADGLGMTCQAIIYSTFIVSSCFLPVLAVSCIGHKWSLVVSLYGYVIWLAANGYANWYTMTISSVLIGISAGPLWTVFGAYINILATRYAELTGKARGGVLSLFFGFVIAMLKSCKTSFTILRHISLSLSLSLSLAVCVHTRTHTLEPNPYPC